MFFTPFSIAITSLGEERANLSAFHIFVRFVLVWICWFPLPLGVWEGLRIVIVELPGLFSYLFFPSTCIMTSRPAIFFFFFIFRFVFNLCLSYTVSRLDLLFFLAGQILLVLSCRDMFCSALFCSILLVCCIYLLYVLVQFMTSGAFTFKRGVCDRMIVNI